jgi:glycosyltransferase involved in cell wall biosynthesis
VEPVPSQELSEILRNQDVYLTASENDPCSNALIEALSCGLPSLGLNSGGHPEIIGYGGLVFDRKEEIERMIYLISANHEGFASLISLPEMSNTAANYLESFHVIKMLK